MAKKHIDRKEDGHEEIFDEEMGPRDLLDDPEANSDLDTKADELLGGSDDASEAEPSKEDSKVVIHKPRNAKEAREAAESAARIHNGLLNQEFNPHPDRAISTKVQERDPVVAAKHRARTQAQRQALVEKLQDLKEQHSSALAQQHLLDQKATELQVNASVHAQHVGAWNPTAPAEYARLQELNKQRSVQSSSLEREISNTRDELKKHKLKNSVIPASRSAEVMPGLHNPAQDAMSSATRAVNDIKTSHDPGARLEANNLEKHLNSLKDAISAPRDEKAAETQRQLVDKLARLQAKKNPPLTPEHQDLLNKRAKARGVVAKHQMRLFDPKQPAATNPEDAKLAVADQAHHVKKLKHRMTGIEQELGKSEQEAKSNPGLDDATRNQVHKDIKELNALRFKRNTQIGLGTYNPSPNEAKHFNDLEAKTEKYRVTYMVDANGNFPDEAERARLKNQVSQAPINKTGLRSSDETVKHLAAQQYQGGVTPEGFKNLYRFNRSQATRRGSGLRSGEQPLYSKGGITIGANQEQVVNTTTWTPIDSTAIKSGHDEFHVQLKSHEQETSQQGDDFHIKGASLRTTLAKSGLPVKLQETADPATGIKHHQIITDDGQHLNPDEIAQLQETLHSNHGIVGGTEGFKSVKTQQFARKRSVVSINEKRALPIGITPGQVAATSHRQAIFKTQSRVGIKYGERDPITGELDPDQHDTIGVRIGHFAPRYQFNEDTDGIGIGTSYRPGSTEVSQAALAMPRAKRDQRIFEAYHSPNSDQQLSKIVDEEHPELETDGERDQQKGVLRKHAKDLAGAGFAATYYSAKHSAPQKAISGADSHLRNIKLFNMGQTYGNAMKKSNVDSLVPAYKWGIERPLGDKIDRFKYRLGNPLGDPNERRMAGITMEQTPDHLKTVLPSSWHYRKLGVDTEDYAGRKEERTVAGLKSAVASRKSINDFLESDSRSISSRIQARSAIRDPEQRLSDKLVDKIGVEHKRLGTLLESPKVKLDPLKDKQHDWAEVPKYRAHIEEQHKQLGALLKDVSDHPEAFSHASLQSHFNNYADNVLKVDRELPASLKIGLGVGTGVAALAGGSVLAVDKYQTMQAKRGREVNHPVARAIADLKVPTIGVEASKHVHSNSSLNQFLDIENKPYSVPRGIKVGTRPLLQKQTISRDALELKNAPLIGGLGFRTPKVPKGATGGLIQRNEEITSGTKNFYAGKHRIPIDVTIGEKERWGDANHKLTSSSNKKMSPTAKKRERESLVRLSTDASNNLTDQGMQLKNLYAHDKTFQTMLSDPEAIQKARGPQPDWDKLADAKMRGYNQTAEAHFQDQSRQRRQDREALDDSPVAS